MFFLYRIKIPVPDYCGESTVYQEIYIETDNKRSPSLEEVINIVESYYERDSEYYEYCGGWMDTLNTLKEFVSQNVEFPTLLGSLIETNSFVILPKVGKVSLTATLINPYKLVR